MSISGKQSLPLIDLNFVSITTPNYTTWLRNVFASKRQRVTPRIDDTRSLHPLESVRIIRLVKKEKRKKICRIEWKPRRGAADCQNSKSRIRSSPTLVSSVCSRSRPLRVQPRVFSLWHRFCIGQVITGFELSMRIHRRDVLRIITTRFVHLSSLYPLLPPSLPLSLSLSLSSCFPVQFTVRHESFTQFVQRYVTLPRSRVAFHISPFSPCHFRNVVVAKFTR